MIVTMKHNNVIYAYLTKEDMQHYQVDCMTTELGLSSVLKDTLTKALAPMRIKPDFSEFQVREVTAEEQYELSHCGFAEKAEHKMEKEFEKVICIRKTPDMAENKDAKDYKSRKSPPRKNGLDKLMSELEQEKVVSLLCEFSSMDDLAQALQTMRPDWANEAEIYIHERKFYLYAETTFMEFPSLDLHLIEFGATPKEPDFVTWLREHEKSVTGNDILQIYEEV